MRVTSFGVGLALGVLFGRKLWARFCRPDPYAQAHALYLALRDLSPNCSAAASPLGAGRG
jgi:hypothetical protein